MKSFPVHDLAAMNLPGMPTTRQGWHLLVKTQKWEFVETHGRGRGGVRREYIPPPEVMALIEAQQAEALPAAAGGMPDVVDAPYPPPDDAPAPQLREAAAPYTPPTHANHAQCPVALDINRLRLALTLTKEAARAVAQPMTAEQEADLALTFYKRLAEGQ